MPLLWYRSFFSEQSGTCTKVFYLGMFALTIVYSSIALISPLITPTCDIPVEERPPKMRRVLIQGLEGGLEDAPNPSYVPDPCRWRREVVLLGMNKWEVRARAAPRTPLS